MGNMIRVKRSYFCDSPFQVFTCMHIEFHERTNADLYILDLFDDAQRLADALQSIALFRKVIVVHVDSFRRGKGLRARGGTLYKYLHVKSLAEKFLEPDVIYDQLYFSCNHVYIRLARFYYIRKGYPTQFVLFDEGTGSYDGHFEVLRKSDLITRYIMFGRKATSMKYDKYLYRPELYQGHDANKQSLHRLPGFDEIDSNALDTYLSVFNHSSEAVFKPCIYFDGVREEVCETPYALNTLNQWVQLIEEELGYENMLIKSHPRAGNRYPHRCDAFHNSQCPMEVEYLIMDLQSTALISLSSTAVLTPKILFDEEPIVLLLSNIDKDVYQLDERLLSFFLKVRGLYKHPERFMIPNSIDELKQCLSRIREELCI